MFLSLIVSQIVSSASTDLQDYTYYFVPAPWLSCKLLRLLQCYPPPEDGAVKGRLVECLETILNKAQEPPKSKKVQHSNAKNAILFEAISLIIHYDRCTLSPFLTFRALFKMICYEVLSIFSIFLLYLTSVHGPSQRAESSCSGM